MSGAADLSIGDLIDRFTTESIRLWHLMDQIKDAPSNEAAGIAARTMIDVNARRRVLMAAITRRLEGAGNIDDTRTYGT